MIKLPSHVQIVDKDYQLQERELEEREFTQFLSEHCGNLVKINKDIVTIFFRQGYTNSDLGYREIVAKVVLDDRKERIVKRIFKLEYNKLPIKKIAKTSIYDLINTNNTQN